ncbi:glycosyltransferase family 2 protein [Aridibaculum aurantiacum]|uniref:glycosyltransferase family 2 protein n=1 Tax=Aridibaculum aurantiacum TaxID=2810307 RepID=UPI001A978DAC|nr:glycosyltransferase family 2 protein [Aridibaculum aurantiacum]
MVNQKPYISICIPAYKRLEYLSQLLVSISQQTFKDFEVVITDDSADASVGEFLATFECAFSIIYIKNPVALGTPENWNEAIRHANGEWIKLMHDDDWFASNDSLERFVSLAKENPKATFLFSGSSFIRKGDKFGGVHISKWQAGLLQKDPTNLYYENFIGPPSVMMHRNTKDVWYDKEMKWLVDIDFYMRYLQRYPQFAFTKEKLINVGYSADQVTSHVFHDKEVVVKENLLLFQKQQQKLLQRIWNYDYTWRMMRNYNIRKLSELEALKANPSVTLPAYHKQIIQVQRHIPVSVLKIGIASKILMTFSYLLSRIKK